MKKPQLLYYRSNEQIKEYRSLPARVKIRWLEETTKFFYYALPKSSRAVAEKFRKGLIK